MCDLTHSHDSFVWVCIFYSLMQVRNTRGGVNEHWHVDGANNAQTYLYVSHDWFPCVTWLIHMCDMIHPRVWHDSFVCVCIAYWCRYAIGGLGLMSNGMLMVLTMLKLIAVELAPLSWLALTIYAGLLLICVTWLIHAHDLTHWYVWHDSFICVTWLIHMFDLTHRSRTRSTLLACSCF